jgi:Ca-activated chloride channel family protein
MKRIFALVFLFAAVSARAQSPAPAEQQPGTTFKVDVRLVSVFATVTDQHGAPISNLAKDNFTVLEDGKPQKLSLFTRESEMPLQIVLAIDTSSSTRKDISLELETARKFIHSILRPSDAISLYEFSTAVQETLAFTSKLDRVDRAMHMPHVGGATALYDAIYLGSEALYQREGRKVLVLVTDGGDTSSSTSYSEALRAAQVADAMVYSIIDLPVLNDPGRNTGGEHALVQISQDTGGKYYYATNVADMEKSFQKISEELRTQYLLGYYSNQRVAASDFRNIEVQVHPAGEAATVPDSFLIRHRRGYYTSKLH